MQCDNIGSTSLEDHEICQDIMDAGVQDTCPKIVWFKSDAQRLRVAKLLSTRYGEASYVCEIKFKSVH